MRAPPLPTSWSSVRRTAGTACSILCRRRVIYFFCSSELPSLNTTTSAGRGYVEAGQHQQRRHGGCTPNTHMYVRRVSMYLGMYAFMYYVQYVCMYITTYVLYVLYVHMQCVYVLYVYTYCMHFTLCTYICMYICVYVQYACTYVCMHIS